MTPPDFDIRTDRHSLERTVFFSDAVIAIAMTLLALELPVPHGKTATEVWHSLGHEFGTEYLPFLISFAVISAFWMFHHRFFQYVAKLSTALMLLNLLGLLAIVLVPFCTKMLGEHGENSAGPVFYASVMVLFGLAYCLMVAVAQRQGLWRPGTPPTAAGNMIFGAATALGVFALSIPLAVIEPSLAGNSWLLIPVVATLLPRLRAKLRNRTVKRAKTE